MADLPGTTIDAVPLKEYELLSQEIARRAGTNERALGLGLAVLAAGFTFGLKEEVAVILILLPIAFLIVLLWGVFNTTVLLFLSGYRWWVEDQINARRGRPTLLLGRMGKEMILGHRLVVTMSMLYVIFLSLTIWVGVTTVTTAYATLVVAGYVLLLLILLFELVVGARRLLEAPDRAHEWAAKQLSEER